MRTSRGVTLSGDQLGNVWLTGGLNSRVKWSVKSHTNVEESCVQLDHDGQRKRTRVKPNDLNPTWNEKVSHVVTLFVTTTCGLEESAYCSCEFSATMSRVLHSSSHAIRISALFAQFEFEMPEMGMHGDLEVNIQNERTSGTGRRSSFLGRVLVPISTVPTKPEAVRWYPLQKRGLFSHIKGDLGCVSRSISSE